MLDDGTGMEDTDLIVDYLDALVPPRKYDAAWRGYWRFRRLEATARSILDGGSVWARKSNVRWPNNRPRLLSMSADAVDVDVRK